MVLCQTRVAKASLNHMAVKNLVLLIPVLILCCVVAFTKLGIVQLLLVTSGSMAPQINTHDLILVVPQPNYALEDVITFKQSAYPGNFVTHRIVKLEHYANGSLFYTKGDANEFLDKDPVTQTEISGKVYGTIPKIGYLLNPLAFGGLFYAPAGVLVGRAIYATIKA